MRRRAARALDRILDSRSSADTHLAAAVEGLDDRDRRLLRELVLGSLRWLRRLDDVLESASGRPLSRIRGRLRSPLRLALYQILYLERIPSFAAVDRAVTEARRRAGGRAAGFVNAVLRKVAARPELDGWPVRASDPVERLAIETSHPVFLVRRWLERFGEAGTRDLLSANNRPRPIWLLARDDRDTLAAELAAGGIETADGRLVESSLRVVSGDPFGTALFRQGAFYGQDEASQAAALVPPPLGAERVLDAAAAPGGKGFALSVREPTVSIVAADRSPARLLLQRRNQRRLDLAAPLVACDAVAPPFVSSFDRVIADLPCSGTGTLSRHPELKWRLSAEEIERLSAQGLAILEALVETVRPGGILCVVTCSIEREENEDVITALLGRRPELERVALGELLAAPLGLHVFAEGAWRLLPTHERDGFTVHVLRRAISRA